MGIVGLSALASTPIVIDGVERRLATYPNTLAGDPDGEPKFVPELGVVVPTFIKDRLDLIVAEGRNRFNRLKHHIPIRMRGLYKIAWLPEEFLVEQKHLGIELRERDDGFALCNANLNSREARKKGRLGHPCLNLAVNRSGFCRSHGGALHPADKVLSAMNRGQKFDPERIAQLDRVQLFLQGFLKVHELGDDEVAGGFIRNDNGVPTYNYSLTQRIRMDITKELHRRVNNYMQMKLPKMVEVVADIAESDFVEPGDRIKAASIIIERMMGRTPDVVIHGKTDRPYETVFESIESGSREAYRDHVRSERVDDVVIDVEESSIVAPGLDGSDGSDGSDGLDVSSEISVLSVDGSDVSSEISVSSVDGSEGLDGSEPIGSEVELSIVSSSEAAIDVSSVDGSSEISVDDQLKKQKELLDRIKKAKKRRYAARAVGAATVENIPWLLEFKPKDGKYTVKIWCAGEQSEAVVDRIMRSQI